LFILLETLSALWYLLQVRVFKVNKFSRTAEKEGITDDELKNIVNNTLETGQADANLGGDVYKVRIARKGGGKAGGYRSIVFFKSGERTFYQYLFAKSERDNISEKELKTFKKLARYYLSMTDGQIDERLKTRKLQEI
jgi:hypothetical protein